MANLFGCLLGLFLSVGVFMLFLVLNIVRKARNIMSGFSSRKSDNQTSDNNHSTQSQGHRTASSTSHSSKKLFDDDEGEYVDFEEIK